MKQPDKQEWVDEEGRVYRLRRPLHQQTLFWTTLISGIIIFLLSLVSVLLVLMTIGLVEENDHLKNHTSYHHTSLDSYQSYSYGKSVGFSDGLKVTVQTVRPDSQRSMSDESTGTAVVASISLENTSKKPILISPYDFGLYDQDDNIYVLDGSTFDNTQIGINLQGGQKVSFDLVFDGEGGDAKSYSVTYEDASWSKGKSR